MITEKSVTPFRFPIFGVFGNGEYKLQPIYVDDLAMLAVDAAADDKNRIINAIGPETFNYRELVEQIGIIIGRRPRFVSVSPAIGHLVAIVAGVFVHDVIVTRDEIRGLMEGRLFVPSPPTGSVRLTDWARENHEWLGRRYASEMARRRDRVSDYLSLRGDDRKM